MGGCERHSTHTSKIVSSTLHEQHLAFERRLQLLKRTKVGTDIFPNSRMRTSTSLDCPDTIFRERFVTDEEFLVFSGENVVGHRGWNVSLKDLVVPRLRKTCKRSSTRAINERDDEGEKNCRRTDVIFIPQSSAQCQ
jgi:hypothetical protein